MNKGRIKGFFAGLMFFLLIVAPVLALEYDIILVIDKSIYGIGESINLYGTINQDSTPVGSGTITLSLYKGAGENAIKGVSEDVSISSTGEFNTTGLAATSLGKHRIEAEYTDSNGKKWQNKITFLVLEKSVNKITLSTDKAAYYPNEDLNVTVGAFEKVMDKFNGIGGLALNGTISSSTGIVTDYFSCTTGADGKCTVSLKAQASIGEYTVRINDTSAKTTFEVIPFNVLVSLMDSTGQYVKSTFARSQSALVVVKVTINGTAPKKGNYAFSGIISNKSGDVIMTIPSTSISNTTYEGKATFKIDNNFTLGSYKLEITVDNDYTVKSAVFFDVRGWRPSLEKASEGSGFLYGYTAFPGSDVTMVFSVLDLATQTHVSTLTGGNVQIELVSALGKVIKNSSTFTLSNYSNSSKGYSIKFSMPEKVGNYYLRVTVTYNSDTLTTEKVLSVTALVASVYSTDSEGSPKDNFNGVDPVYLKVTAKNSSGAVAIYDITLSEVRDDKGNPVNYVYQSNWSKNNEFILEWWANESENKTKLDNPRGGGWYTATVAINNNSARASTQFLIEPYTITAQATDAQGNYRWQFSKSETVYFNVYVYQKSGGGDTSTSSTSSGGGTSTGTSSVSISETRALIRAEAKHLETTAKEALKKGTKIDVNEIGAKLFGEPGAKQVPSTGAGGGKSLDVSSVSSNPVVGANVSVSKIINDLASSEVSLTGLNISCQTTDTNGKSQCTIKPNGTWPGGWYQVVFKVVGSDGNTTGYGYGSFEARSFYIYAYTIDPTMSTYWDYYKWQHKPSDNLTIRVKMYDAGNYWWWSQGSGGLSGTAAMEKIFYHGSPGSWVWPPVEYDYKETISSATVTDGTGNLSVPAPSDGWKTGSYSVVIKGMTNEGDVDYGTAWFEVRLWDVWANPINIENYWWRDSFATDENVTLFVNIHDAGTWEANKDLTGKPLNVTVIKLQDTSTWPPEDLNLDDYIVQNISVNKSMGYWHGTWEGVSDADKGNYVLNITPKNGRFRSGYYSAVLEVSGNVTSGVSSSIQKETAWGWFNVISFYATTQLVDASGTWTWSTNGTPVYLKVTSTKEPYWAYYMYTDIKDYKPINTTIKELELSYWSSDSWYSKELKYPEDITVNQTYVNGSATINLSSTSPGGFESGYYSGRIVLEDANGDTSIAWVWFEVKPFSVKLESKELWKGVAPSSNVNATLKIVDPTTEWDYDPKVLPGNYTIYEVMDNTWSGWWEYKSVNVTLNTSPRELNNEGQKDITIRPPSGNWSGGWHNTEVKVRKTNTTQRGSGWLWYEVIPFKAEIKAVNGIPLSWEWETKTVKPCSNLTVTMSLTDPVTGTDASGTVSRVYEWTWDPATESGFKKYDLENTTITGTGNFTIIAPSDCLSDGYHGLNIEFKEGVSKWLGIDVRTFYGWAYAEPWGVDKADNVTLRLTVYNDNTYTTGASVNVTNVTYGNWYSGYTTLNKGNFYVENDSFVSGADINTSGKIKIPPPEGNWTAGYYDAKIHVVGGADKATFWASFRIVVPMIYISSPYGGENLSGIAYVSAWADDPSAKMKSAEFYYINSSGSEVLIGSVKGSSWWNTLWNTYEIEDGKYTVKVVGKDESGAVVSSSESGTVTVSNAGAVRAARFTKKYSENLSDTEPDGDANYLQVTVGLNVTSAGYYDVKGYLYASNGNKSYSSNYSYYPEGLYNVTLSFDGAELRKARVNGSYDLKELTLSGGSWWATLDYLSSAYTTKSYNYTQFQAPAAMIVSLSDYVEGTAGSYDNLVVNVTLEVAKPGYYNIYGYLYTPSWSWLGSANNYSVNLSAGIQIIELRFDGSNIRSGKQDGPYDVRWIYLYDNNWKQLDYREKHTTAAYKYTDFKKPGAVILNISDYTEGTAGSYDNLVVNVTLDVTTAGSYKVDGNLYTSTWSYLGWVRNDSSGTLTPGNQSVLLRFDGSNIRSGKQDGPYDVRWIYLYDNNWKQLDYREKHTTAAYKYTDFKKPDATFNNSLFTDQGVDTNADGEYDKLVISASIDAVKSGTYRVSGYLYTEGGSYIEYKSNSSTLDIGTRNLTLEFDGKTIRQTKANGPYYLRYIYLYNDTSSNQLDYRESYKTNSSYLYTMFQGPAASFTGDIYDNGSDTDGDTFFNKLVVNATVNVKTAGTYRVRGYMYSSDWYWLGYNYSYNGSSYDLVLSNGTQNVTFEFDGSTIRSQKKDGPYRLYLDLYDYNWNTLDYLYDKSTNAYNYTAFQKPPASFTGNVSDSGIDNDDDSDYDKLRVNVTVDVARNGTYRVRGYMYSSDWYWLGYNYSYNGSSYDLVLSNGTQNVTLEFDGGAIYKQKKDGPYRLYLDLYDYNWNTLDYLYDKSTNAYNYTAFQKPPASFQSMNIYGYDSDDEDTKFDALRLNITVDVDAPANYSLSGYVYDSCWYGYNLNTVNNFTKKGLQSIALDVAGSTIYNNKCTYAYYNPYAYVYLYRRNYDQPGSYSDEYMDYIYNYSSDKYTYDQFESGG